MTDMENMVDAIASEIMEKMRVESEKQLTDVLAFGCGFAKVTNFPPRFDYVPYYEVFKINAEIEMHKQMTVEMLDGSKWAVPVEMIARNRAEFYAPEFGGDVERSLAEDTIPLFESDEYEIEDWAVGNMKWSDFNGHQTKVKDAAPPDFDLAWLNGEKGFL